VIQTLGRFGDPRADQLKAIDEPIFTKRDVSKFKGTKQEKQLLNLIYQAESENYVKKGSWILKYGDQELAAVSGHVIGDNPMNYQHD